MASYKIIDEPGQNTLNNLIINPTGILFASIFVPFFVNIPYYGRIWLPAVLFIINSLLLRSATRTKEISVSLLSVVLWFAFVFGSIIFLKNNSIDGQITSAMPYIRILSQGIFFFCLIYVSTLQANAYSLYSYINKRD